MSFFFTFSVPYRGGGAVDEPTVPVHKVGHVLGHGEGGAGDGQELGGAGHAELQDGLVAPVGPVAAHNSLDALDVAEVGHVGWLQQYREK